MSAFVDRWAQLVVSLKTARGAHYQMRHGRTLQMRDAAVADYSLALDAIYEDLTVLDEAGALDEITRCLSILYGGAKR